MSSGATGNLGKYLPEPTKSRKTSTHVKQKGQQQEENFEEQESKAGKLSRKVKQDS
jgi:hypothetical protein